MSDEQPNIEHEILSFDGAPKPLELENVSVQPGAHVDGRIDVTNPDHWQDGVCPKDGDSVVFPDARPRVVRASEKSAHKSAHSLVKWDSNRTESKQQ